MTPKQTLTPALLAVPALTLWQETGWLTEAMIGSFVLYLWSRPTLRSFAAVLGLAIALLVTYSLIDPRVWPYVQYAPSRLGYFLGWASVMVLARNTRSPAFTGAACLPLFVTFRSFGVVVFGLDKGPTADGAMFLLDHAIGDPAYVVGQWLLAHPILTTGLWIFYMAVPLTLAMAYGASLEEPLRQKRLLWSWILSSALCVPLYLLCPVAGPAYAFPGWPALPVGVTGAPLEVTEGLLRTGMPSLHLTWVALSWYFAPNQPNWLRPSLAVFFAITVIATLGLGQHFIVDLFAAVPYMVVIGWLVTRVIRPVTDIDSARVDGRQGLSTPHPLSPDPVVVSSAATSAPAETLPS
jgi:hypothetical protein